MKSLVVDYDSEDAREYARSLKASTLKRFTSEELIEELRERSNRRVIAFNSHRNLNDFESNQQQVKK